MLRWAQWGVLIGLLTLACRQSQAPTLTSPSFAAPAPLVHAAGSCASAVLPAAPHSLEFLYMWDDSYLGNVRDQAGAVDATLIVEQLFPDVDALDRSFADAVARRLPIYFAPNADPEGTGQLGSPATDLVVRRYWYAITALHIDEPAGTSADVDALTHRLAEAYAAIGLYPKPWQANFTERQMSEGDGWRASSLSAIGYEALADPASQDDPAEPLALRARIDRALARLEGRPVFLIVLGYDRNGRWTNMEALRALQTVPYLAAVAHPRVRALWIFSLGRAGGTLELPACIRREHERMWAAAHGQMQPQSLSCVTGEPVLSTCHEGRMP